MSINLIVGMTKNRVIGKDNALPWNIPQDLKNFKELTQDHVVIMGRKTYDSLPLKFKPLPRRHNIVVSSTLGAQEGIDVCRNMEEAIRKAKEYQKEIFIIGGATIYRESWPFIEKMYVSYVKKEYEGDTYFPPFEEEEWEIEQKKDFTDFEFVIYRRKN